MLFFVLGSKHLGQLEPDKRPDKTLTAVDGCFCFINLPDGEYTLRLYKVNATTHIFTNENEIFCTKIPDNKISKKDKHRWEDIFINVDIIPTIKGKIKDETKTVFQSQITFYFITCHVMQTYLCSEYCSSIF